MSKLSLDLSGTPIPPSGDVFQPFYQRWMGLAFSGLKPATFEEPFPLIQYLWATEPSNFNIISPLHQNTEDDRLHFSVEFTTRYSSYRFHIYGFYKNVFVIKSIEYTVLYMSVLSQPKIIATF